jgi:hypothetical protein
LLTRIGAIYAGITFAADRADDARSTRAERTRGMRDGATRMARTAARICAAGFPRLAAAPGASHRDFMQARDARGAHSFVAGKHPPGHEERP